MGQNLSGVVLGFGSVGKRHTTILAKRVGRLAIVESKESAREQAQAEYPAAAVVGDLDSLKTQGWDWSGTIAVIATWGPSHAAMFHALADRGVKRMLCEKPMASSIRDAFEMVQRSERDHIRLAVHHYIRYAGFVVALRKEAAKHQLGDPVLFVAEGGAACLMTNGIHLIDFASELFQGFPNGVISTASGEHINPRSPDLHCYGGTIAWTFDHNREAVLTLSNRSSIGLSIRIFYRNAIAQIDGDLNVSISQRDQAAVERFPAVTRTGSAVDQLFMGGLPGVRPYLEGMREAIESVETGEGILATPQIGFQAVTSSIGALVASREGRRVSLPVRPESKDAGEQWPIS